MIVEVFFTKATIRKIKHLMLQNYAKFIVYPIRLFPQIK
ncbi:hypothetical protein SAMN04488541_105514 [Thermoflexibacter ruber]|uniref:Uncharacterized protein n=1 Tax=Thermoflexibacter ruber TaxID=1003 RepID=A0A1I2JR59_9BACT|nr:hypothetical protein SAMN04488541_105514 [Thermoflexibacter ruber]